MCGILGIFSPRDDIVEQLRSELRLGRERQRHRGPDEQGEINLPHFCAAHNRLSIIDIATGQQPMTDAKTGNVIVFNGEIYNYIELRERLMARGHIFETDSDTEVILKCYSEFGRDMLPRLNGMFALAIYDRAKRELLLARDRFGEKPLYFFSANQRLFFASELTTLRRFSDCPTGLNQSAVLSYFATGCIAGPNSILTGVSQLMPGTSVVVNADGAHPLSYYERRADGSNSIADSEILESLTQAIALRLRADVPVASLLSGGIDSSLITLIAQRVSQTPLHTFAFGWSGEADELPYAREVARMACTEHHEIRLEKSRLAADVEVTVSFMDMPQADSAAFVVYQLSKSIAEHGVKVVLSGDGGDELFGGYPWYQGAAGWKHAARGIVRGAARAAEDYVTGKLIFPVGELDSAFGANDVREFVRARSGQFESYGDSVNGRISYDYASYLPWMLMPKVDRMSMAHAVEVRAPLLDHNLVDRWAALPGKTKVSLTETKHRIKNFCVNQKLLTRDFISRKKMGMNLPISWIIREGESMFRDVVLSSSSESAALFGRSRIEGWFDAVARDSGPGWSSCAQRIWTAYIFELWNAANRV